MSNNSTCQETSEVLYLCGYSIIALLGLVLNGIAIYLFFHRPKLRSPTTVYMKNLALADLLLVCILPLRIYGHTLPTSELMNKALKYLLCDIAGTFLLLNMYGSIFLLTCISFDRYLAVCFPIRSRRIRQKAPWICLGVWFLNLSCCGVTYALTHSRNGTSDSCFHGRPPYVTKTGPAIGTVFMGFLVPAGIITVSSVILLKTMGHSQVVQEGLVNKVKILHMLTANIGIFLLCFLPYHTVLLLYQVYKETSCFLDEAYKVALLTACCNTVLDPFAYYFATETMKNMVKEEIKGGKFRLMELSDLSFEKNKQANATKEKERYDVNQ
ncbi:lysophosphatidic acid receptor 4-like [Mixophyes fleayi]|uniref:lysophosphatidic acid receptor 4-like n=1 Tax=Mixophyes fleayi TaxID=3061075 RepID=UPI003F4DC607